MPNLARNGYTEGQVRAALHAATRMWTFRYDLYDKTGVFKRPLSGVRSGAVEYNAEAAVKRTAKFELLDTSDVDWLNDRIRPWARLRMPDSGYAEFSLGMFVMPTTPRAWSGGVVIRKVEAYDLAQLLLDPIGERYSVAAGANVIAEVRLLLTGLGITAVNLTASDKTVPADRDWDPKTPVLTIINDLLHAVAYDDLWFDGDGVAVAAPYVSPIYRASSYTYRDDDQSVMLPEVEQNLDVWGVPNHWVRYVSEADVVTMRSEYTNSNPGSPTSTVSRGRTITSVAAVDAVDQPSLDAIVARAAFEASQVYEVVQLSTATMPMHSHRDVLTLEYSAMGIHAQPYEEIGWGFELKRGAVMKHSIRRIVTM